MGVSNLRDSLKRDSNFIREFSFCSHSIYNIFFLCDASWDDEETIIGLVADEVLF